MKYTLPFIGFIVMLFVAAPVHAQHIIVKAGYMKVMAGSNILTSASGTMAVATGSQVNIYGNVEVGAGVTCTDTSGIVIHSAASGDGSFIFGAGTPKGTIQRFITHGMWHQVSIPVTGDTVNDFYFNRSPETWLASRNVTTGAWDYLTVLTDTLSLGEGFDYFIKTTDETVAFTGTLSSADLSLNSTTTTPLLTYAGDGYNLVGNPYAAPVNVINNATHNWTFTSMEKTVWVLDNSAGGNYLYGTTSGIGNTLPNGNIAMGQAFLVHVTAAAAALTIPAARRTRVATTFKSAQASSVTRSFIMDVKKDSSRDEIWVSFGKNGTTGFDNGYDASKMFGSKKAPQLYIRENNVKWDLSIDYLPDVNIHGHVVKVSFVAGEDGKQTFTGRFSHLNGVDVILEDLQTGKLHNFSDDSIYTFEGTKKDNPNRFLLHFGKVLGIDNPASGTGNINIYSFDKAVYIHTKGVIQPGRSQIAIYDLMGRTVFRGVKQNASVIRIPLSLSHTYVIVRVVNQKNKIKVSKVYLQ